MNPSQNQLELINKANYKLLEAISKSLGYKDKITWDTIQSPYIPKGLYAQMRMQGIYNHNMSAVAEKFNSILEVSSTKEDIDKEKNKTSIKANDNCKKEKN